MSTKAKKTETKPMKKVEPVAKKAKKVEPVAKKTDEVARKPRAPKQPEQWLSGGAIKRLMVKAGTTRRISKSAREELVVVADGILHRLTKKCVAIAKHSKRQTIKHQDVKAALEDKGATLSDYGIAAEVDTKKPVKSTMIPLASVANRVKELADGMKLGAAALAMKTIVTKDLIALLVSANDLADLQKEGTMLKGKHILAAAKHSCAPFVH